MFKDILFVLLGIAISLILQPIQKVSVILADWRSNLVDWQRLVILGVLIIIIGILIWINDRKKKHKEELNDKEIKAIHKAINNLLKEFKGINYPTKAIESNVHSDSTQEDK